MISLRADNISRSYGRRAVVSPRTIDVVGGERLGIIGPNGSGKSTLLRILAGVLRPDTGDVALHLNNSVIDRESLPQHVGLVAPYLNVYEEFTPMELLAMQGKLRGVTLGADVDNTRRALLQRVGLGDRADDTVRTFSSGLRQRVLLALAVHLEPAVLFLDEPTITLDDAGRKIVEQEITTQSERGGIVVIATNDERERQLCTRWIELS